MGQFLFRLAPILPGVRGDDAASSATIRPAGTSSAHTFVEILPTGPARVIDDQDQIREYEQHLTELDSAMQVVLPDGIVSDLTLEERLRALNEVIRRERLAQYVRGAHISPSSQAYPPSVTQSESKD